jgi:cytoskeletal protein CcmA (bactofilin family)
MPEALHGQLKYHLDVTHTVVLLGRATRGVTVHAGGHLLLHGQVSGDVRVKDGGRAVIDGAVDGALDAEPGATVVVTGQVSGPITGPVLVQPATRTPAVVRG